MGGKRNPSFSCFSILILDEKLNICEVFTNDKSLKDVSLWSDGVTGIHDNMNMLKLLVQLAEVFKTCIPDSPLVLFF